MTSVLMYQIAHKVRQIPAETAHETKVSHGTYVRFLKTNVLPYVEHTFTSAQMLEVVEIGASGQIKVMCKSIQIRDLQHQQDHLAQPEITYRKTKTADRYTCGLRSATP